LDGETIFVEFYVVSDYSQVSYVTLINHEPFHSLIQRYTHYHSDIVHRLWAYCIPVSL